MRTRVVAIALSIAFGSVGASCSTQRSARDQTEGVSSKDSLGTGLMRMARNVAYLLTESGEPKFHQWEPDDGVVAAG